MMHSFMKAVWVLAVFFPSCTAPQAEMGLHAGAVAANAAGLSDAVKEGFLAARDAVPSKGPGEKITLEEWVAILGAGAGSVLSSVLLVNRVRDKRRVARGEPVQFLAKRENS